MDDRTLDDRTLDERLASLKAAIIQAVNRGDEDGAFGLERQERQLLAARRAALTAASLSGASRPPGPPGGAGSPGTDAEPQFMSAEQEAEEAAHGGPLGPPPVGVYRPGADRAATGKPGPPGAMSGGGPRPDATAEPSAQQVGLGFDAGWVAGVGRRA